MTTHHSGPWASAVLALAFALAPPIAMAATPAMNPGLWRFEYRSSVTMAGRILPSTVQTSQSCVRNTSPTSLPFSPTSTARCTPPQLQKTAEGYQAAMTCTATASNGMVSHMQEVFHIVPAPSGNAIAFEGRVVQVLTGMPQAMPPIHIRISAVGHRVGPCPAP